MNVFAIYDTQKICVTNECVCVCVVKIYAENVNVDKVKYSYKKLMVK